MLFVALVLIVVGVLLFAFVHPRDHNAAVMRNIGAGALILAGVALLVLFLAGVFDASTSST